MANELLQALSDGELLAGLKRVGEPLLAELQRRGYRVRVENADGERAAPTFTMASTAGQAAE